MDIDNSKRLDVTKFISSMPPTTPQFNYEGIPQIDPKSTIQYKIQEQTKMLMEQNEQQITMLGEQNEQLRKLVLQQQSELDENKNTLGKSDRYNKSMKKIAIIACMAAIASFVFTVLIGFKVIG